MGEALVILFILWSLAELVVAYLSWAQPTKYQRQLKHLKRLIGKELHK